jgi:hypothetical protein
LASRGCEGRAWPLRHDCWRLYNDPDVCERIASKNGPDIRPGTWQFALVDTANLGTGLKWLEYKAQAQIRVPVFEAPSGEDDLPTLPQRMAWVRRTSENTNTSASYSNSMATRIGMMRAGIHDCRLSVIDQETGIATISGYTYASVDSSGDTSRVVAEDDIRMAYVIPCGCLSTSIKDSETSEAPGALQLTGLSCPTRSPVRLGVVVHEPGAVRVDIFDATGRRLQTFDLGRLGVGTHEFTWDGKSALGERVSAGVYWIQASLSGVAQTKRVVLLGR